MLVTRISRKFPCSSVPALIVVSPKNNPRNKTARIGPIAHKATIPKLSSSEPLSPRAIAIPEPKARINGTIIGPVVTPPESNETGTNSGATKSAIRKINEYEMINKYDNFI